MDALGHVDAQRQREHKRLDGPHLLSAGLPCAPCGTPPAVQYPPRGRRGYGLRAYARRSVPHASSGTGSVRRDLSSEHRSEALHTAAELFVNRAARRVYT